MCKVTEIEQQKVSNLSNDMETVRLDYVIQNIQPLVMSNRYASQTDHYIRGQSVLGALAENYLSMENTSAEDKTFQDLFLKGEAIFSDLFFSCPDNKKKKEYDKNEQNNKNKEEKIYRKYIPAPLFINQLKKSKKYVNLAGQSNGEEGEEDQIEKGNTPRKLKTKFVYITEDNVVDVAEPVIDIVYHHSKKQISANGKREFYMH